jgi:hypothetical protein
MSKMMLYAPYLYCNEDEFAIFNVKVDSNFWESSDIERSFRSHYSRKLEVSGDIMVRNIIKEHFDYDKLVEAFQLSFDYQSNAMTNSIKQKVQEEYEKSLGDIADSLNIDLLTFTGCPPDNLGQVILFDTYGFVPELDEFAKRLKILQYGGGLIDYYINQGIIEKREEAEGFPSEKTLYNTYTHDDFRTLATSIICG